jgi:hypothetical protein
MEDEQLTLPLEMPVYTHYTVELRKGVVGDMQVVRHHMVPTVDAALNIIDGFVVSTRQRDDVTWQSDEVDAGGNLFGLAPHGVVYQISCVPPLSTELNDD